jgi:hypothetical protein
MEAELRSHLIRCAHAYAALRRLELVTVGRLAAGDWRFFERIEGGAGFTARKYDETIQWFSENWPEGEGWPSDVPRPNETTHCRGSARKRRAVLQSDSVTPNSMTGVRP